jgi:hypothetical protein
MVNIENIDLRSLGIELPAGRIGAVIRRDRLRERQRFQNAKSRQSRQAKR